MAASASRDACQLAAMEKVKDLATWPKYLPQFAQERHQADGETLLRKVMSSLEERDGELPRGLALVTASKGLDALREVGFHLYARQRMRIVVSLWKLFACIAAELLDPGSREARYTLAEANRVVIQLRSQVRAFHLDHMVPEWMSQSPTPEAQEAIQTLQDTLNIRVMLEVCFAEMGKSYRADCVTQPETGQDLITNLMDLCVRCRKYMRDEETEWLHSRLEPLLDGRGMDALIFSRLLGFLTPSRSVPKVIASGQLWKWWSVLPAGFIGRFDLMWFRVLGSWARRRWCGMEDAQMVECTATIQQHLPWLLNKICSTCDLPAASTASIIASGDQSKALPPLAKYDVPDNIMQSAMGQGTSWKYVAKFIVLLLESAPEKVEKANGELDAACMWSILASLLRRFQSAIKSGPAQAANHAMQFMSFLSSAYLRRISRERLDPNIVPAGNRLPRSADEMFAQLMLRVVDNALHHSNIMPVSMMSLGFATTIANVSALHSRISPDQDVAANPFSVTPSVLVGKALELLNDPASATQHMLQVPLLLKVMPSMLLRHPQDICSVLEISLMAINATDLLRTLAACSLLMHFFQTVPALDLSDFPDWPGWSDEAVSAVKSRWPMLKNSAIPGEEEVSSARTVSSLLPGFVQDLLAKAFEFIQGLPKEDDDKASMNAAGILSGMRMEESAQDSVYQCLFIATAQLDNENYAQVLQSLSDFIRSETHPENSKPFGRLVAHIVRANPEVAVPALLPGLLKRMLRSEKGELEVAGGVAKWLMALICGIVRFGGASLLSYQAELEALLEALLGDERDFAPKLAAKLLRRILASITSTWVVNDFRICNADAWTQLLALRDRDGRASKVLPVHWSLAAAPWWWDQEAALTYHTPSDAELTWAKRLVSGCLLQVERFLKTSAVDEHSTATTEWLSSLKLPAKKKASHRIQISTKLIGAVKRGTGMLWPDERSPDELAAVQKPLLSEKEGTMGAEIFTRLGTALLQVLEALGAQEQAAVAKSSDTPSQQMVVDQVEIPSLLEELISVAVAVLGGGPTPAKAFCFRGSPSISGGSRMFDARQLQLTVVRHHRYSEYRNLSRMRWAADAAQHWEWRTEYRMDGYRFRGLRRQVIECVAGLAMRGNSQAVRHKALTALHELTQMHMGVKWPLLQNVFLPALYKETNATLACRSLTGDQAEEEHRRLNNALEGVSMIFTGQLRLARNAWRRGAAVAAPISVGLCEAVYAATQMSQGVAAQGTALCEVKANTVSKLILAATAWLKGREIDVAPLPQWKRDASASTLALEAEIDAEIQENEDEGAVDVQSNATVQTWEAFGRLLDICGRGDSHWRAQVCATAHAMALLTALRRRPVATTGGDFPRMAALRWLKWLVQCLQEKTPVNLQTLAVLGLQQLLKCPFPLLDSDMSAVLLDGAFFAKATAVLPLINHAARQDGSGSPPDPTQEITWAISTVGPFCCWPSVWMMQPKGAFTLGNTFFWHGYFNLLRKTSTVEQLRTFISDGAEYMSKQPVGDVEYHIAFTEFFAGCLRALRRDDEVSKALRRAAWDAFYPRLLSEFQAASQETLNDWASAFKYITSGTSRPLMRQALASKPKPETLTSFLVPLLNFATNPSVAPSTEALTGHFAAFQFSGEGVDGSSSFDSVKRLRLISSIIGEMGAGDFLGGREDFLDALWTALQDGISHPYKQLREEVSRLITWIMHAHACTEPAPLRKFVQKVEPWMAGSAKRLVPLLRADGQHNSQQQPEVRPPHVLEGLGLVYVLTHAGMARMIPYGFSSAFPEMLEFLIVCTGHDDFELRAVAQQALEVGCFSVSGSAVVLLGERRCCEKVADEVLALGKSITSEKDLDKLLLLAMRPVLSQNYYLLFCGDGAKSRGDFKLLAESMLGHTWPKARYAARGVLANLLTLESDQEIRAQLKHFKSLAGPLPKKGSTTDEAAPPKSSLLAGVMGMLAIFFLSSDWGMTEWTGETIEKVAPYGKASTTEAGKEVQKVISTFLKMQQSSRKSWMDSKAKLSAKQLDLLDMYKASLGYYS